MRRLAVSIILGTVLLSETNISQAQTRDEVVQALSGFEANPTRAEIQALGPNTVTRLVEVYNDRSRVPFVRLRAVSACGYFPIPAVRTFLLAVARLPNQSDLFVREAVLALGRGFGERAVNDVQAFLSHSETVVREAAGAALARMESRVARQAIQDRLQIEPDAAVRESLRRRLLSSEPLDR